MSVKRSCKGVILSVAIAVLAAACAETELVVHTAKQIGNGSAVTPNARYKVGSPYQIAGTWYYPKADYAYSETGVASWYGPNFHGKRTANGDIFDQNALTAAHRTLPMPSMVRVTNLENGRTLALEVNDRGPFAKGRIIDVSRRAAQLLGFQNKGTALVKVEVMATESRKMAALAGGPAISDAERITARPAASSVSVEPLESKPVQTASLDAAPPPRSASAVGPKPEPTGKIGYAPTGQNQMYVQAGSFVRYRNAATLSDRLGSIGPSHVVRAEVGNVKFFRVRIGPLANIESADTVLAKVIQAGEPNARIVVVSPN